MGLAIKKARAQVQAARDSYDKEPQKDWLDMYGRQMLRVAEFLLVRLDAARERIADLEDVELELRGEIAHANARHTGEWGAP